MSTVNGVGNQGNINSLEQTMKSTKGAANTAEQIYAGFVKDNDNAAQYCIVTKQEAGQAQQQANQADANVQVINRAIEGIQSGIALTEGRIVALETQIAKAPEEQKESLLEQLRDEKAKLENQQKMLQQQQEKLTGAQQEQQSAQVYLTSCNTAVTKAEAKQSEAEKQVTSSNNELKQKQAEAEKAEKAFNEAISKAANNIENADGSFDGKKNAKTSHLEESIALANQTPEDRETIQKLLVVNFDATKDNFDKNPGRSATHGYAVEERDLADLNEVTGMLGSSSSKNVAKMYQCAVPLNGDDVFKMEADTAAELLKESKSPEGFSEANKAKILNALDNGFQGETPLTHTKYDRRAQDVLTNNHTANIPDDEIQRQIDTIKDKVSGKNKEPLTEKEFRTITYLYDIEAGGEKIGITNWDGSLGVQEGQQFNKKALEVLVKDTEPKSQSYKEPVGDSYYNQGGGDWIFTQKNYVTGETDVRTKGKFEGKANSLVSTYVENVDFTNPMFTPETKKALTENAKLNYKIVQDNVGIDQGYTDKNVHVTERRTSYDEASRALYEKIDSDNDGNVTYKELEDAGINVDEIKAKYQVDGEYYGDYGFSYKDLFDDINKYYEGSNKTQNNPKIETEKFDMAKYMRKIRH